MYNALSMIEKGKPPFPTSGIFELILAQVQPAIEDDRNKSETIVQSSGEYLAGKIKSSAVILNSGAEIMGFDSNYLYFASTGLVIHLGLPDPTVHSQHEFRAQLRGKQLDLKKYIDEVVAHVEKRIQEGTLASGSYSLVPLRETIEYMLKTTPILRETINNVPKHIPVEVLPDDDHLTLALWLEQQAIEMFEGSNNTLDISEISIDGLIIPRRDGTGLIRFFDVECYV